MPVLICTYLVINKCVTAVKVSNFSGHYLRNRSTLDIGVLGYIGIVWPKEHSAEVWHIPSGTPCIYFVCVFVVLGFQNAAPVLHIVIYGLPGTTVFFHIISQAARFSKKVMGHKTCVLIFFKLLFETFLNLRRNEQDVIKKTYTVFTQSYSSKILMKFDFSWQIFEK